MIVPLLAALALVLVAAKLGGWASNRLGQPAILGELLVGIVLGPSVFNVIGLPYFESAHIGETLHELGELGVIFLMFTAGLEIEIRDLAKMGKSATLVGILGEFTPVLFGAGAALALGYDTHQAIFLGLVLAATSVSISAQTLIELGHLRTHEGLTLLGAAVVDDILAIALLSGFVAIVVAGSTNILSLIWIIARMFLFLGGASILAIWLLPRIMNRVKRLPVSEPVITAALVFILIFAWASEAIGGVAAITGAFVVGLSLSRSPVKSEIERGMHTISYSLFVPIFLVSIGLTANIRALSPSDLGITAVICLVAILTKWLGAGAGARLSGMSWLESARVGIGMASRGEVGLIVANVGLTNGIIDANVFTIIVVMVLVTTVITPPLLRLSFRRKEMAHA
jgi:Kef-type K+ transport system membrane component KefB